MTPLDASARTGRRAGLALLLLAACASTDMTREQNPAQPPALAREPAPDLREWSPDASELLEADLDFAATTRERGLEGWLSYYDESSVKIGLSGPAVRGLAAIREQDAALFADTSVGIRWEPDLAGWIEVGALGFTRGHYWIVRIAEDGVETDLSGGTYINVWRRLPVGWRAVFDAGIPGA